MELIGRVLWWSERDGKGIIVDPSGNEFYFDSSVLNLKPKQIIKRKSVVTFNVNDKISHCLCAHKVCVPVAEKRKKYERTYEKLAIIQL